MPATALGLRYPSITDEVRNGYLAVQQLAEDVNAALTDRTKALAVLGIRADYATIFGVNPAYAVLVVRGGVAQTESLTQWQTSGGIMLAHVTNTGALFASGAVSAGSLYWNNASLFSQALNSGVTAIVGRGVVGQTANLLELQNSAAAVLARVDAAGNGTLAGLTLGAGGGLYADNVQDRLATGAYLVTNGAGVNLGALLAVSRAAGNTAFTARGVAAQTAALERWENSSGTALASVDSAGKLSATGITNTAVGAQLAASNGIAGRYEFVGGVVNGTANAVVGMTSGQGGLVLVTAEATGSANAGSVLATFVTLDNGVVQITTVQTVGTLVSLANAGGGTFTFTTTAAANVGCHVLRSA